MSATSSDVLSDPTTDPAQLYTVNRVQDGMQDRAELTLDEARRECAMLNAQARVQVGVTAASYDERGGMVLPPSPIFGGMVNGEISQYEIRSASGLVIS